jgi:hypothetical protein
MNQAIRESKNRIEPVIRLQDGASRRVWFPQTLGTLLSATKRKVRSLLRFYGLPKPENLREKKAALKENLGITL